MKICVSSAYCLISNSFSPIYIPPIFVLFRTFWAKISAQRINKYGEVGIPDAPVFPGGNIQSSSYCWLHNFLYQYTVFWPIILWGGGGGGGGLNFSKHWYMNAHSTVSNGFSKSTAIIRTGMISSVVKCIKHMIIVMFWPCSYLLEG